MSRPVVLVGTDGADSEPPLNTDDDTHEEEAEEEEEEEEEEENSFFWCLGCGKPLGHFHGPLCSECSEDEEGGCYVSLSESDIWSHYSND
ncbi:MAG: hypothetical protein CMI16_03320 [Opitutaceae bacterium]|nr:hypothetical protein [Opitutaceae bacterium]|tara:strand:+ start:680 stop:949 length:270 start_codon:yes stop_codon:yes gene_type:complete